MSSMYLYYAFQSSEEFSALETSSIAYSFLRGSVRSGCPPPVGEVEGDADGDFDGAADADGEFDVLPDGLGPPVPLP
jgi:hypothetical protein